MFKPVYFNAALIASDISGISPYFIYAQWCHETDDFTSDLCLEYNNLGGLTQFSMNDLPQPDGSYYYAKFSSLDEFGSYFGRYLLLYDGIGSVNSLYRYCVCLRDGGYFGDSLSNYYAGVRYWFDTYRKEMRDYVDAQKIAQ